MSLLTRPTVLRLLYQMFYCGDTESSRETTGDVTSSTTNRAQGTAPLMFTACGKMSNANAFIASYTLDPSPRLRAVLGFKWEDPEWQLSIGRLYGIHATGFTKLRWKKIQQALETEASAAWQGAASLEANSEIYHGLILDGRWAHLDLESKLPAERYSSPEAFNDWLYAITEELRSLSVIDRPIEVFTDMWTPMVQSPAPSPALTPTDEFRSAFPRSLPQGFTS